MKTQSPRFLQKRKFFLFLPLLILPFITLLFWALGGGKGADAQAGQQAAKGGLNLELPDAHLKDDKSLDKLSYYEKAASDSAKREELMKNDPYYMQYKRTETKELRKGSDTALPQTGYNPNLSGGGNSFATSPHGSRGYSDPNEAKVYSKLNELNTALNRAAMKSGNTTPYSDIASSNGTTINSADMDRLEQMMDMTGNGDGSEDPEMKQLNAVMEKILDIQHPERVKEKIKQTSKAKGGQVLAVTANSGHVPISLLTNSKGVASEETFGNNQPATSGFFSIYDDREYSIEQQNVVQAVVHQTQTVVEGAIIKLRLVNDVYINGTLIPKDNFVFGTASLSGERLHITITSVRYKNALFPVQLAVVDMDGIDGIYVPHAMTRDVAKGAAERAVQGVDINTLNPSIGAQAANVGIEAAKTLLSRKAKRVKVTVKAGYQVLLRGEKQTTSS
jgi:conjugative transposon TraM protein